jgi:peptide/nickel transport system substrate-binding protein
MKKILLISIIALLCVSVPLAAGGRTESASALKTIRVAENVPGLITPGVWDGQAFTLNSSIYEYLVEVDAQDNSLKPVLATDWSTDDGTVWTFHLREGVRFHDGTPFDAWDVKFTLERTQDSAVGHLKKADFSVIKAIDVVDDHTVVVTLKERRPTFIMQMTDYNMAILSRHYDYTNLGERRPMGTGPFLFSQMVPKENALLVRNPDYWDPALPKVDRLEIYFISDLDAKVAMLEGGQVDVVPLISPVAAQRLAGNPDISVIAAYQEQRFIAMAVDRKPFDDNRVRLAFKYTMDPDILARSVAQTTVGDGFDYSETPILNSLPEFFDQGLRKRDIAKARSLLAEAGYPDGVSVDLYYASDHPYGKELSQTVAELAAPAGFSINLKGFTRDVYLSQYWLKVGFSITGWGGRIDPSILLSLAFHSQGPWNEAHLADPVVDSLIDRITGEADEQVRTGYYRELQQRFYQEGALVNIQVPKLVALSSRITDYRHPLTMIVQYKYADID